MAKSHLDQALSRWEEMDASAQQELDQAVQSPALSAWERAQAKINAAQAARELNPPAQPLPPQPMAQDTVPLAESVPPPITGAVAADRVGPRPSGTMIQAAYTILGVPQGSDFETVRQAYMKLKERAAPERFPAGSADQVKAQEIERRVNAAYMMLMDALAPAENRFDRLEL